MGKSLLHRKLQEGTAKQKKDHQRYVTVPQQASQRARGEAARPGSGPSQLHQSGGETQVSLVQRQELISKHRTHHNTSTE